MTATTHATITRMTIRDDAVYGECTECGLGRGQDGGARLQSVLPKERRYKRLVVECPRCANHDYFQMR